MDKLTVQIQGQHKDVTVVRKRMKTVRLKVQRDGKVVLSAPYAVTDRWIRQYIESKTGWIQRQLEKINTASYAIPPVIQNGTHIRILGSRYIIQVVPSARNAINLTDTHLMIHSTRHEDQEALQRQLDRWWRRQTMDWYTASLQKYYPLVQAHGVQMPALRIRKMKTLWGSCSIHGGAVTLNYYLYKFSPSCIDYIVLHELAHFLYRYHDKDFYGFIARYMPDWKECNRTLKSEYPG